jgi:hypothetical protein
MAVFCKAERIALSLIFIGDSRTYAAGDHNDLRCPPQYLQKAQLAVSKIEKAKAHVRAKVEHPFRVIKRLFVYVKTRFRCLTKNTMPLLTLLALSILWMACRHLLTNAGEARLQFGKWALRTSRATRNT